jgi:hypothetical protein
MTHQCRVWHVVMWVLVGTFSTGFPTTGRSDEPADAKTKEQASFWMQRKLNYSQNILAGITSGDFDKVAENADAMRRLSKVEAFVRSRAPGYRVQLEIFDEANQELLRQANKDNIEGAALAFTQLTISCVSCHRQLRESKGE